MYRTLAGFALALLKDQPDLWIAGRDTNGSPVWFVDTKGDIRLRYHRSYKRTLLGAMRAAEETLSLTRSRPYSTLYQKCLTTAQKRYNKTLTELSYDQCCDVLYVVATEH